MLETKEISLYQMNSQSAYKVDLLQRLQNREYAAEYLSAVLAEDDPKALLLALRDVIQANNISFADFAKRTNRNEKSLYRSLSLKGNPQLDTLTAVLRAAGYQMAIVPSSFYETPDKAAG